jgi:hypothetical protein
MEINSYDRTLKTFNALVEVENKRTVAKRREPHLVAKILPIIIIIIQNAQGITARAVPPSSQVPTTLTAVVIHKETAASIPNAVTILVIVPSTMIALSMEINSYDRTLKTFNALVEVENKRTVAKRREPPLGAKIRPLTTPKVHPKGNNSIVKIIRIIIIPL